MKKLTKPQTIGSALVISALLLIVLTSVLIRSRHNSVPHVISLEETATAVAQNGEMSKQDYLNFSRIEESAEKRGSITEEDFDWILNLRSASVNSRNPDAPELRRLDAAIVLRNVKNLSPAQKERGYQAISPQLASSSKSDKIGAIAVMENLEDKRALPALTRLLADSDPTVRSFARKTIQKIEA